MKLLWILESLVSCLLLNYSLSVFFSSFSWVRVQVSTYKNSRTSLANSRGWRKKGKVLIFLGADKQFLALPI